MLVGLSSFPDSYPSYPPPYSFKSLELNLPEFLTHHGRLQQLLGMGLPGILAPFLRFRNLPPINLPPNKAT